MKNHEKIKKYINKFLKESMLLNELQKHPNFAGEFDSLFKNLEFYIKGEKILSGLAEKEIVEECSSELRLSIMRLQMSDFEYNNFYIIKFSDFYLTLSNSKKEQITFSLKDSTDLFKNFSTSFVVYIYHDLLFKIIPYNDKLQNDQFLEKEAKKIIDSNQFQKLFSTEKQAAKFEGEIITKTIDKKIILYINYFNQNNQEPNSEKIANSFLKKEKKSYRANTPFLHKMYGRGIIKSVKKILKPDMNGTLLNIEFPEFGSKKIFLKNTEMAQ